MMAKKVTKAKSNPTVTLPMETLTRIMDYLPVEDIKSCRLVCRTWRSCCNDEKITDKEKFVFRSPACSTRKINNFLATLKRNRRINVEFINVDLKPLMFYKFGRNIKRLEITNCFVDDISVLKNILSSTLNMKHLVLRLDKDFRFSDRRTIECVIAKLRWKKFHNNNLETYEYLDGYGISVSQLCAIYPRLKRIRLQSDEALMKYETANMLRKSNVEVLYSVYPLYERLINFRELNSPKTFEYTLSESRVVENLTANLSCHEVVRFCSRVSLQQSGLKELVLEYPLTDVKSTPKDIINMLFLILRKCKNLKKLSVNFAEGLSLSSFDAQKFCRLIILSSIEYLELPRINGCSFSKTNIRDMPNGSGKLKHLRIFGSLSDPYNIHHVLLNQCSLEFLHLKVEQNERWRFGLSENVQKILNAQKNLRTLKVDVFDCFNPELEINAASTYLRCDNLQNLELHFYGHDYSIKSLINFMDSFFSWDFPNLVSFSLRIDGTSTEGNCRKQLKNMILEWLRRTKSLHKLELRYFDVKIEDCLQLCKHLTRLQSLEWTTREHVDVRKVTDLFFYGWDLRLATIGKVNSHTTDSNRYYYCRSKNRLYRCAISKYEGATPYSLVGSVEVRKNDWRQLLRKLISKILAIDVFGDSNL